MVDATDPHFPEDLLKKQEEESVDTKVSGQALQVEVVFWDSESH